MSVPIEPEIELNSGHDWVLCAIGFFKDFTMDFDWQTAEELFKNMRIFGCVDIVAIWFEK